MTYFDHGRKCNNLYLCTPISITICVIIYYIVYLYDYNINKLNIIEYKAQVQIRLTERGMYSTLKNKIPV